MNINDIIIKNEWDDTLNQRVIIIYGNSLNNNINRNGQLDIISSPKEKRTYYHAIYLAHHANFNYQNDEYYQKMIEKSRYTFNYANIIYIQSAKYNNIIFEDTTLDNSSTKYGLLHLPCQEPTNEQYNTLHELASKLQDYEKILVYGKPYITKERTLDNEITFIIKGSEASSLVETIKSQYNSKLTKRI